MKISVIIPTFNEGPVVTSAVKNAWLCGADEVIVVDGGSQDSTVQAAADLECRLLISAAGRGKQLNAGAASATGDVFLFLHADTSLANTGCDQIRRLLNAESIACGAFRQKIASRRPVYRMIEAGNLLRVWLFSMAYGDQGMFIRRGLFEELHGFDEIPLMEDFKLSQRIRKKHRIHVLKGPLTVSPRRWEASGPIRQTLKNWSISLAFLRGTDAQILADKYNSR